MKRAIPVSDVVLGPLERAYANDALTEGAISGLFGKYISKFEDDFSRYSDCKHGVAVSSGTTALHLALVAMNPALKPGDEVLVSTLTNMATFFAVLYQGARPVPIDIEPDTLNLDPKLLEGKVTPRTRAILVVHLFGHPVDMDPVLEIARRHNLVVIEDCAEAHGATYNGKKVGSLGDVGCFSFYANKIITTGEGGMLTTSDRALADRAMSLRSLAFGDKNKFMHKDVGYNYRLTNLQAAIGCGQLSQIEDFIENKRRIARFYNERLGGLDLLELPKEKSYARNVYWMYHVVLKGRFADRRSEVLSRLREEGIETREGFIPYNMQELFVERGLTRPEECPVANSVALRSFYLPSSPRLRDGDLDYVASCVTKILGSA